MGEVNRKKVWKKQNEFRSEERKKCDDRSGRRIKEKGHEEEETMKTGRKQTRDRNRREGGESERFGKAKSGLLYLLLPGEGKFS